MNLDFILVHNNAKKNNKELGQYLAILTSHLVNNAYIYTPNGKRKILNTDIKYKPTFSWSGH